MCWSRGKDGQAPICLVSPCGDICPLGGMVAAKRPLLLQKRKKIMCMALGVTLTTRIMAIEYAEHVLESGEGWSGAHLLGVSMW